MYKNALNECSFGCGCPTHNCNEVAISLAQSANITVAIGNNITHALRAYHFHRLVARVPSLKKHIPLISKLRMGVRQKSALLVREQPFIIEHFSAWCCAFGASGIILQKARKCVPFIMFWRGTMPHNK